MLEKIIKDIEQEIYYAKKEVKCTSSTESAGIHIKIGLLYQSLTTLILKKY